MEENKLQMNLNNFVKMLGLKGRSLFHTNLNKIKLLGGRTSPYWKYPKP